MITRNKVNRSRYCVGVLIRNRGVVALSDGKDQPTQSFFVGPYVQFILH